MGTVTEVKKATELDLLEIGGGIAAETLPRPIDPNVKNDRVGLVR